MHASKESCSKRGVLIVQIIDYRNQAIALIELLILKTSTRERSVMQASG
jgi:hypothetical protein